MSAAKVAEATSAESVKPATVNGATSAQSATGPRHAHVTSRFGEKYTNTWFAELQIHAVASTMPIASPVDHARTG